VKLLLTSSGVRTPSVHEAMVRLLGKPMSEASALIVPTGIYPFSVGPVNAQALVSGTGRSDFATLGWRSVGVFELTALPSIQRATWESVLEATDVLYVWGGNVMYLRYWMEVSGLAALLPSLEHLLYIGVSAGSIVLTPFNCDAASNLTVVPEGHPMTAAGERGLGLVDFALAVHLDAPDPIFEDHTLERIAPWASQLPYPTYAIDDETAIVVDEGEVTVISEGTWHRFAGLSGNAVPEGDEAVT
jgi:dipeptidase E